MTFQGVNWIYLIILERLHFRHEEIVLNMKNAPRKAEVANDQ